MLKNIDIILAARPDHSYGIYRQLLKSDFSFRYVSFKLLPQWLGKLLFKSNIRTVDGHGSISIAMTLINWLRYNKNIKLRVKESVVFSRFLRGVLKKYKPRLLHYWPDYFADLVFDYSSQNPHVRTLADIYFPCRQYIMDTVSEDFRRYGLDNQLEALRKGVERYDRLMEIEKNYIVPSAFVAESYKKYYPNNHFYIVSYGIEKWSGYKKKDVTRVPSRFVYVGTISIAKGCDILCEWFKEHVEYQLHLYGKVNAEELHLFERYYSSDNIHFEGVVDKVKVQATVSAYDIGIHLSRFDAYSLAVAEVIGCGLPVVISCYTGSKDDVLQNELGVVTELKSDAVGDAIAQLVHNYGYYVDKVDEYLTTPHKSYQEKIMDFYGYLLKGKDPEQVY